MDFVSQGTIRLLLFGYAGLRGKVDFELDVDSVRHLECPHHGGKGLDTPAGLVDGEAALDLRAGVGELDVDGPAAAHDREVAAHGSRAAREDPGQLLRPPDQL